LHQFLGELRHKLFNLRLLKTISKCSTNFKIFPYSTDSVYDYMNIKADDGSGYRYKSINGNIWLASNLPDIEELKVQVSLYGGIINKPRQKYLYFLNNERRATLFGNTIIIGNINVKVDTIDENNVSKVEFYIDDILQFEDENAPFNWLWRGNNFAKHNLLVKTHYINGYISEDKIDLWKFF